MKPILFFRYIYLTALMLLFSNSQTLAQSISDKDFLQKRAFNSSQNERLDSSVKTVKIPISTLGIKGELFEEGYYYYFDSFDILNDNQLAVVGINRETGNFLKIINMENNSLMATIPIQDDPVEMTSLDGKIIIYGRTSMMSIDEDYHLTSKPHNIRHYDSYNKMVTLGDELYIYMGNGSAFRVDNLDLIPLEKIQFHNQDIWIQKLNANAFDLTVGSEKFNYRYESGLGSMTILGENNGKLIFETDIITQEVPLRVVRRVSSPSDEFTRNEMVASMNRHSYLKNDLKYKEGKLYTVSIDAQNITLTIKDFAL